MFLGIDLGTSGVKAVLMDDEQTVVGQSSQPLSISNPKPLWSEQNPEDWWQATEKAILQLKNDYATYFSAIKAIGLSGQQHGATFLDNHHQVIRPAILWNDGRAKEECEQINTQIPQAETITGNCIMPGFTAPKALWLSHHEPEQFKRIAKVLLPKDYLRLKITGNYATDVSDAAGTVWLNTQKRQWSSDMLAACHLNETHMPKLFEGPEVTGTVLPDVALKWGIDKSTVVIAGAGDNPASAISLNVIQSGHAFLSLGTSGVYFVATDQYQANPKDGLHTFCHCLPNRWHHMSVHLSAANCLTWFANLVQEKGIDSLLNAAAQTPPTDAPIFLPYLSGERTPHNNPYAQGVFFGMTHNTHRANMMRAVMEGVAFAFADGQDAITHSNITINEVSVVGGGAKNHAWGAILASVLNRPLIYRQSRDVGAALGAARLAWLAAHKTHLADAFINQPIENIIEPDISLVDCYAEKRFKFRKLYQDVKELYLARA